MTSLPTPTRRGVVTLLLALWQITSGGVRFFAVDSLRTGAIDLRPLSRTARLITIAGLLLVAGFLVSILFNDVLRVTGALELLRIESGTSRGLMVPAAVVPLTYVALTLGWTYVLTGALHVRRGARWLAILLYVFVGLLPLLSGLRLPDPGATERAALVPLALLVLVVLLLPRRPLPLGFEFSLVLLLHGALVALALFTAARVQATSDNPFVTDLLTSLITSGRLLVSPFLLIAGLEMVNFGLDASGWVGRAVHAYDVGFVTRTLLLGFLGYRLFGLVRALAAGGVDESQLAAWGGAALLALGFVPIVAWRRRFADPDDVPGRLVVALVILATAGQALAFALVQVVFSLVDLGFAADLQTLNDRFLAPILAWSEFEARHRPLLLALAGVVVALIAGRRRHPTVAAFGMILAWAQLLEWLMAYGRPLARLRYTYADVDVVLLLALAGATLVWLVRRRLTDARAMRLLVVVLLLALLNQTDFLDNPFSPLFGFAGVFFLVFGIAWNVVTVGGRFANTGTPSFPRNSRLLLYIGYVLLTVCIMHWYLVSHNIELQTLQASQTFAGFRLFGLPLAYLVLVEGGERLLRE